MVPHTIPVVLLVHQPLVLLGLRLENAATPFVRFIFVALRQFSGLFNSTGELLEGFISRSCGITRLA